MSVTNTKEVKAEKVSTENSSNTNKKLFRTEKDRMIAGVCGGLAVYFDADPTIVRLVFLILLLMGGSTFWVYILMAIIIPNESNI